MKNKTTSNSNVTKKLNTNKDQTAKTAEPLRVFSVDLAKQYQNIKGELDEAISGALAKGIFILGENVERFEAEFAAYCGVKFGIGVASGTDALRLALQACGIGAGDEVITVSNTAFATAAAISLVGATPVFADVDETYTIDVNKIEPKIGPRTKAILPVHLFGIPANMSRLMELAKKHNLFIIEDACQAHGAEYQGRRVGSIGHLGCFSFYPTKNLACYGDGGFITTNDEKLAEKLKLLRNYGQTERFYHNMVAGNSRLDELHAAVLRVKLKMLDRWNETRREHAMIYDQSLRGLKLPVVGKDAKAVYHQYVVRFAKRDGLRRFLLESGVSADIHYPVPIHLSPAYAFMRLAKGSLPVTERFAGEILSLPVHPELSKEQIERIASLVNQVVLRLL